MGQYLANLFLGVGGVRSFGRLAILCTFASGCAYSFGSRQTAIPGGYNLVAVPVFKNQTVEAGAETFFTRAMIEELERAHKARLVPKEESEVVIEGTITGIQTLHGAQVARDAPGFSRLPERAVLTKEFRLLVTANVQLRKRADDTIIWTGSFVGEQRYAAPQVTEQKVNSVNALYNFSARYQTLRLIATDMMQEAHDRLVENF